MTTEDIQTQRTGLKIKRIPITWMTLGFIILVCISLILMDGWRSWTARKNQLREMETSTANMARAIAQHADDTIKAADTALIAVKDRMQTEGRSAAALEQLHAFLVLSVAELPQLNGLFVYDENGRWLVNAQASIPANANNSDRDYFIYHRDHQEEKPYIGLPIRSRSTGAWIITVSRRLNHANGSFAGVALATISIDYFNKFYDRFNIGKAGAIVLVLNRGIMLTRRPLLADSIGKSMLNAPVYRDNASKKESGTFTVNSVQDGVRRQNSFLHLEKYPLFTSVALSEDEILTDWLADTYLHSAGVLILIIILGSLGFHLLSQLRLRL